MDWGMKNRLSKIIKPKDGHTVMLAVDHGYFMGPTSGLERIDVTIVPLLPYADTLMCTRGIVRTTVPPTFGRGIVLRACHLTHRGGEINVWFEIPSPEPAGVRA